MDYFLKRIAGIAVLVLSLRSSYAQTAGTAATNVPVTATGAPTEAGWGGCVDPNNPSAKLELGKLTTICITLSSSSEWNIPPPSARTLRLSFQPEADEYSRFHVPSSYKDLIQDRATNVHDGFGNVTIHASSQNVLSYQRMFYETNGGAGRIYPYLTAIIDVREGDVKGITWDDACLFCSDDKCVENTYDFDGNLGTREEFQQPTKGCYIQQTQCFAASGAALEDVSNGVVPGPHPCDILVYVVWTGDDKNGKAFQSSNFRYSAFPEQNIQDRITDSLPDFPDVPGFLGGGDSNNGA